VSRNTFSQKVRKRDGRCLLAEVHGVCDGALEAHHLIPKQRINHLPISKWPTLSRKEVQRAKRKMREDARNGMALCSKHHSLVTARMTIIPADLITEDACMFASQHGIEWALEREIPGLSVSTVLGVSGKNRTGKTSRRKGKTGELEVVHKFHAHGFNEAKRSGDAQQHEGDLTGVPDYTEVRRRERQAFPAWIKECREESGDRDWALWTRRSNEEWAVTIDADHYLELLRKQHDLYSAQRKRGQ
jgi:hypothetical protein